MLDICSRPLDQNKPIPRKKIEAKNKFELEAPLEEIKTITMWEIDFRGLLIKLPDNKFVAWTTKIKKMLNCGTSTAKNLEKNICCYLIAGVKGFDDSNKSC